MYPQQQRINQQYRQTQVMSADPIQLVIMTYDLAIVGCQEGNLDKVTEALTALRSALNFDDGGQVAADLLGIYLYLADQARDGNYAEVERFLRELRQTWTTAREQFAAQPQMEPALTLAA